MGRNPARSKIEVAISRDFREASAIISPIPARAPFVPVIIKHQKPRSLVKYVMSHGDDRAKLMTLYACCNEKHLATLPQVCFSRGTSPRAVLQVTSRVVGFRDDRSPRICDK